MFRRAAANGVALDEDDLDRVLSSPSPLAKGRQPPTRHRHGGFGNLRRNHCWARPLLIRAAQSRQGLRAPTLSIVIGSRAVKPISGANKKRCA